MKTLIQQTQKNSLKLFFMAFIALTGFNNAFAELIPGTDYSVHFESGNIIGTGRSINMHHIPVIDTGTGTTTFYDISFEFTYTPATGLEFNRTSSAALSPLLSSSNLIPGTYKDETGYTFVLDGPSSLPNNRLLYTLSGNAFSTHIITGSVYGHPDIGGRAIIDSLSDTLAYGLIAVGYGQDTYIPNGYLLRYWPTNGIVGLRQTGNTLTISLYSFRDDGVMTDYSSPKLGVTLTRVPE